MFSKITTALLVLITSISTTAHGQVLQTSTARSYLPTATTFNQSQIDSFNNTVNYQHDIVNGSALTYPDLTPIQLTWNGTAWTYPTPIAITNNFTSLLMVGTISHQATATPGAVTPNVVVDWPDVVGTTQYRFRWRIVGGSWSASTVTGSQRTLATLAYNTTYEVQVRVYINSTTQGEYTNTYTFTTPQFVPLPSCNAPSVTGSISGNVMTLQWSAISQATAYQVEVRQLGALSYGGTTTPNTSFSMTVQPNTSYEYRVRSSCTGTATSWSEFSTHDTLENAICTPPTGLYNVGNTFYWTNPQYVQRTQIQTRLVGTATWGGTTIYNGGNSWSNPILWGQHEWRVRSVCYGTSNTGWTAWSSAITTNIPKPLSFEQYETELAYPNPCSNVLHYNGTIVLRDVTGRIVAKGENEIDTHQLADGMYFLGSQRIIIKH